MLGRLSFKKFSKTFDIKISAFALLLFYENILLSIYYKT